MSTPIDRVTDQLLGPRDVVVVEGPDAATYLHSQVSQAVLDLPIGDRRWTFVLDPTGKVDGLARVTRTSDQRFDLDTDAGLGATLLARLDRFRIRVKATTRLDEAASADPDLDTEAARIAVGWPRLGAEIVPGETIPGGTGLTAIAVDFTKGCYPGQELVERMDSRGAEPPRSLRRVTVSDGTRPGDPVLDATEAGVDVGVVTSVAGTDALAWIKRGHDVGVPVMFEP